MNDEEFLKYAGSGGLGMAIVGSVYLLVKCLSKKCGHSKTKSSCNSGCCQLDIEAQEDSIKRKETENRKELINLLIELGLVKDQATD